MLLLKGITKRHREKYTNVVVRLGEFHTAENFMGTIGFFMKDCGIEELLEATVCQRGTAKCLLEDYKKKL